GFSAGLFAFYYDDDGKPMTQRYANGLPEFNESLGLYQWSDRVVRSVSRLWDVRGPKMLQHNVFLLVTPRVTVSAAFLLTHHNAEPLNYWCPRCMPDALPRALPHALPRLVSADCWLQHLPAVSHVCVCVGYHVLCLCGQEEVRKHFNCPILDGMELENQGGLGTELNHWEKRLLEVSPHRAVK
ncbi:hypothetical protein FKM82_028750, partial [Ascaphus truei]